MTRAFSSKSVQSCKRKEKVKFEFLDHEKFEEFKLTGFNISTSQFTHWTEVNTNKFTETGRVVITDSLGVTERFKNWIGLDDLIFQVTLERNKKTD